MGFLNEMPIDFDYTYKYEIFEDKLQPLKSVLSSSEDKLGYTDRIFF